MIYLFALDNPARAPGKRPIGETDAEEGHKQQRISKENEELEEQFMELVLQ